MQSAGGACRLRAESKLQTAGLIQQVETDGEMHCFEAYRSPVEMDGHRVGTVGFARDITNYKQIENELRSLAMTDPLTELANRRYFLARLEEAFALMQRDANHQVTVLMPHRPALRCRPCGTGTSETADPIDSDPDPQHANVSAPGH